MSPRSAALLFSAALTALAAPLSAQETQSEGRAADGEALYMDHCATCHGIEARGNGPMAPVLVIQPPDLTALARKNGGAFPLLEAASRIDGRDPLVAHGSPMPVYGPYFEGQGADVPVRLPSGQHMMTSAPVAALLEYLITLQSE